MEIFPEMTMTVAGLDHLTGITDPGRTAGDDERRPDPEVLARARRRAQPRALAPAERQAILDALHSPRFADLAPAEVWAILHDEGTYLASQSTFYRLLPAAGETRERRRQAVHPAAVKPELLAAGPNQVWSWDITRLHGRRNGRTTTFT
jgi:transposase InsO family protein